MMMLLRELRVWSPCGPGLWDEPVLRPEDHPTHWADFEWFPNRRTGGRLVWMAEPIVDADPGDEQPVESVESPGFACEVLCDAYPFCVCGGVRDATDQ